MAIVKVKEKFQITLPVLLRDLEGIVVGDLLEVDRRDGYIRLRVKQLVDRKKR